MSRFRYSLIALFAAAAASLSAGNAQALFQIRLTAYTSAGGFLATQTFTDNVGGDSNPLPGVLGVPGSFSLGNFTVIFSQGISKPLYPLGPEAHMHLNSLQVSSTAGGQLLVELTDTGWGATGPGNFVGAIGGTQQTGSTVSFQAYKSLSNEEFAQTNLAASVDMGTYATTAYSNSLSAEHGVIANPYSMTLVAFLTHSGLATSSFDFDVTNNPVPEPATIVSAILGAPLLGGYFLRRRKAAKMLAA